MQRYLYYFLLLLIPIVSNAQSDGFVDNASIIADKIEIDANGNLKAKGNVEILDKINKYLITTNEITYEKEEEIIYTKGNSKASSSEDNIIIYSEDFNYNRKKKLLKQKKM